MVGTQSACCCGEAHLPALCPRSLTKKWIRQQCWWRTKVWFHLALYHKFGLFQSPFGRTRICGVVLFLKMQSFILTLWISGSGRQTPSGLRKIRLWALFIHYGNAVEIEQGLRQRGKERSLIHQPGHRSDKQPPHQLNTHRRLQVAHLTADWGHNPK